jgi:hypothetical protein
MTRPIHKSKKIQDRRRKGRTNFSDSGDMDSESYFHELTIDLALRANKKGYATLGHLLELASIEAMRLAGTRAP